MRELRLNCVANIGIVSPGFFCKARIIAIGVSTDICTVISTDSVDGDAVSIPVRNAYALFCGRTATTHHHL